MILIKKNKEPIEWKRYRTTPGAKYKSIDALYKSLIDEQGYICAYCMRRIPTRDKVSNENHRIEHVLSRDNHPDKQLDYSNMVICCPGHIDTEDHCDKKKSSADISFSPTDSTFIDTLSYDSNGNIKSSNSNYDKELNDILNLNAGLLKINRKSVLTEIVTRIKTYTKNGKSLDKSFINKMIDKYSSMKADEDGHLKYLPYCGVAIYYLKKKLRTLK